jgi:hypothetical protein
VTRDETTRKESSLQAVNSSSSWHRLRGPRPRVGCWMDGRWTDASGCCGNSPARLPSAQLPLPWWPCWWPLYRATVQWSLLASTLLASCQDGLPVAHWIWLPDSNPLVARQPGCCLLGGWSGVCHWHHRALPPHLGECS